MAAPLPTRRRGLLFRTAIKYHAMSSDLVSTDMLREAIWKVKQLTAKDGPIHGVLLARLEAKLAFRLEHDRDTLRASPDPS